MTPPGADTVLVRYGEVHTKSDRVARRMEGRLLDDLRAMLAARGVEGRVERRWTRPLVRTRESEVDAAAVAAADVFGVVSASPALSVPSEKAAIEDALARTARDCYEGGTFAVDARRADGDLPFSSAELEEDGGAAVWAAVADRFDPAVDLDDPDVTLHVECREAESYVYLDAVGGPGGLPLGSQDPVAALVSGGIDSPVAAYEVMRRGSPVVPVYVDLGDYGGADHRARAVAAVETLAAYAPGRDLGLYRVPGGDAAAALADAMDRGRMLALRRYMFRVAEHLAEAAGARGIVTGESIGQKSSQTARNLGVTARAVDLPVHRPLLTRDKTDIAERAREIGTFDDSTIPAGCPRFAPPNPETNAAIDRLREAEPDDLFERATADAADAEWIPVEQS